MPEKKGSDQPTGSPPTGNEPTDDPPIPEDDWLAAFPPDDEQEPLPEEGDFWIDQDSLFD